MYITQKVSSFYRSFSDIFMGLIVFVVILLCGWEPYNIYGIVGKGVGIFGFGFGNFIFSSKKKTRFGTLLDSTDEHNFDDDYQSRFNDDKSQGFISGVSD